MESGYNRNDRANEVTAEEIRDLQVGLALMVLSPIAIQVTGQLGLQLQSQYYGPAVLRLAGWAIGLILVLAILFFVGLAKTLSAVGTLLRKFAGLNGGPATTEPGTDTRA